MKIKEQLKFFFKFLKINIKKRLICYKHNFYILTHKIFKKKFSTRSKNIYLHIQEKTATTFFDLLFLPHLSVLIHANYFRIEQTPFTFPEGKIDSIALSRIDRSKKINIFLDKKIDYEGIIRRFDYDYLCRLKTSLQNKLTHDDEDYHIIMIRDPRELIVSLYHSFYFTHAPINVHMQYQRKKEIPTLNDFLEGRGFLMVYIYIKKIISAEGYSGNQEFFFYEDMVTEYKKFINNIIDFINIKNDRRIKTNLFNTYKNDFIAEGDKKHKRNLIPGKNIIELSDDNRIQIENMMRDSRVLTKRYLDNASIS